MEARNVLAISTKMFGLTKKGPNDESASWSFELDYVDLIFCYNPDPRTPIEETVRAMNGVIDQGWAFYWRTIIDQLEYNILERSRMDLYHKYNNDILVLR
uniref:Uncharacterized protein n=1 Tax=Globisporangium ultimum (strain ATCC 200006 / CBS 805.95 / DAOM BR144) TaxID=431595 RepID=K3WQ35_GLOUD